MRAIIQKQEAKERIDKYNENPNLCLCCKKPILAPYGKKLRETKRKKFCNKSCAAKYNNVGKAHNANGLHGITSIIDSFTDKQIYEIYQSSCNLTDFSLKLGYKTKIHKNNNSVLERLEKLGLSIDGIANKSNYINELTKGELFSLRSSWNNARSSIQKMARNIYINSNKPKKCIVCGYIKHYEVAHIKAVSDFDDVTLISEINDEDNLIALCPNHHWEYDNTDFDITPYLNGIIK